MKALLLKDFYVLRKQMWVYAIIVLAWGVVPQAWLNLLAVVYGSIIPYSAMAYDQRSRWDKFTRMLPYSDQAAVMSRYVLGWLCTAVGGTEDTSLIARPALHAYALSLTHPVTGEHLSFTAPIPADMEKLI